MQSHPKPSKRPPKERKPLKRSYIKRKGKSAEQISLGKAEQEKMWAVFLEIWAERPHVCTEPACNKPIYGEPLTIYFHHPLEKGNSKRFQFLKLEKYNIRIRCGDCHTRIHSGKLTEYDYQEREEIKQHFNIN